MKFYNNLMIILLIQNKFLIKKMNNKIKKKQRNRNRITKFLKLYKNSSMNYQKYIFLNGMIQILYLKI